MTEISNGGHERWEGDAAAYSLDALDGAEARAFEEHLAACNRCQSDVALMRRGVDALPAASPVEPGPALKERVMATVRAEADTLTRSARAPSPSRRPAWRSLPGVAAAGATAVALVVLVVVLSIGSGSSTRTYTGSVSAPGASASLRQSGNHGVLKFSSLPGPPTGRIYEVWLTRPGAAPQPTGTLFSARSGTVAVGGNLHGARTLLVTAEPRPDGSRSPTRAPIIVVRLA